jgi:hypothetical protein
MILWHLRWRQQAQDGEAQSPPDPPADAAGQDDPKTPASEAAAVPGQRCSEPAGESPPATTPSWMDELGPWWSAARHGDRAEAYRGLVELDGRSPGEEEICLRLYWLLTIDPRLDPQRDPSRWLVEGLKRGGLQGRLLELYLGELDRNPDEAAGSRCGELLDCPGPSPCYVELVVRRWMSVGRVGRYDVIAADLARLRESIPQQDLEVWGHLLLAAIHQLAWDESPATEALVKNCCREAEYVAQGHAVLHEMLARCDFLFELVGAWRELKSPSCPLPAPFKAALSSLIHESWNRPIERIRVQLLELLDGLIEDPRIGLGLLEQLRERAPAALYHLGDLVEALAAESEVPQPGIDPGRVGRDLAELLQTAAERSYQEFRPRLLAFCLREALDVDQLLSVLLAISEEETHSQLAQVISRDASLRYLAKAAQVFWA